MPRTPAETNQIIHEAIYGKDKHHDVIFKQTHIRGNGYHRCIPCDRNVYDNCSDNCVAEQNAVEEFLEEHDNPNYLEHGKPWGEMINWAMKQEWWEDFLKSETKRYWWLGHVRLVNKAFDNLIANPSSLAEHMAEYLSKEEGK